MRCSRGVASLSSFVTISLCVVALASPTRARSDDLTVRLGPEIGAIGAMRASGTATGAIGAVGAIDEIATAPAALAGVDLVPAAQPALYPGGTAFALVGVSTASVTVLGEGGERVRRLEPCAAGRSTLVVWDGRDDLGAPFRGIARVRVAGPGDVVTRDLRPLRASPRTHGDSQLRFTVRATAG